jgi:hypothetical protein
VNGLYFVGACYLAFVFAVFSHAAAYFWRLGHPWFRSHQQLGWKYHQRIISLRTQFPGESIAPICDKYDPYYRPGDDGKKWNGVLCTCWKDAHRWPSRSGDLVNLGVPRGPDLRRLPRRQDGSGVIPALEEASGIAEAARVSDVIDGLIRDQRAGLSSEEVIIRERMRRHGIRVFGDPD